jgi:hypothetical protein
VQAVAEGKQQQIVMGLRSKRFKEEILVNVLVGGEEAGKLLIII